MTHKQNHDALKSAQENERRFEEELDKKATKDKNTRYASDEEDDEDKEQ